MGLMNGLDALAAAKIGSVAALWARIDAGVFPRPIVNSSGFGFLWDEAEVLRAIVIKKDPEPDKREQPQPPARTRERKDEARTETRESE